MDDSNMSEELRRIFDPFFSDFGCGYNLDLEMHRPLLDGSNSIVINPLEIKNTPYNSFKELEVE